MTLVNGTKLGPHEILAPIGSGGMGNRQAIFTFMKGGFG